MHHFKIVQGELGLKAAHNRISSNINTKLAFELVNCCRILRLRNGKGVIVNVGTNETVAPQDLVSGDGILQVVEAEVDAPAVNWNAGIEERMLK